MRFTEYFAVERDHDDDWFDCELSTDTPLYVDPFLLRKSPSLQDNSLHTALVASFNHFGRVALDGNRDRAIDGLIRISECSEAGLGSAVNKKGKRIGRECARRSESRPVRRSESRPPCGRSFYVVLTCRQQPDSSFRVFQTA